MSTLEDFDRILAELSPPGGSSPAVSAPATTTVSASVTVSSPARNTVQPPRPSVAVAPVALPTPASSGAPSSNAAKIAELESLLADLGPVHMPSGSSGSAGSGRTPTPPAGPAPGTSFTSTSTSNTTVNGSTPASHNHQNGSSTTSTSSTFSTSAPNAHSPSHAPNSTTTTTTTSSFSTNSNNSSPRAPQAPSSPSLNANKDRGRTASISVSKAAPAGSSDSIVCGKCHEKITGTYIAALDRNWHPDHFTCSSCSKSLDGNFFETDKGILCTECASEQIRCTECKLPITGTHLIYSDGRPVHNDCVPKSTCGRCHNILSLGDAHVEALDKLWHPECFACTRCMTPLGSTFVQYEGTPYCQPCIQILSKERNIVFKS